MKILVINSGSSSLKFQLIANGRNPIQLAKGHIDGIGMEKTKFTFSAENKNIGLKIKIKNHEQAFNYAIETLLKSEVISSKSEIDAIGHRVVHGGEKYTEPIKIGVKVIKEIEKLSELAPLHNPHNLKGILACKNILKNKPQVAVFDTAFHSTLPEYAYLYGLPFKWYEKYGVRKYGFHGTSHKYVTKQAQKLLKKKAVKIVSCHLGNGSSITASQSGKSIDTSMGFTPLEGIIMGTRSGSIDPAIVFHMQEKLKLDTDKIDEILNNESGLLGLSGISSDMRKIYEKSLKGDKMALLTIEVLSYQCAKFIGSYAAALNGLDAVIFTGGLGQKAFYVRQQACDRLSHLGLKLNKKKNEKCEEIISEKRSKVKVFVIPTNEEIIIASETQKVLK
ncbi:acetate/propionate family kinase [Candidatus Peregrinibacteria bacterium]|nr:acetate/propionate family kinase [Candidatus Peregrinibacteria bacterium]